MNDRGDIAARDNRQSGQRFGGIFTMALAVVAFLVLNLLTPEYHDDFVYKFMFEGGAVNYDHPIRNLGDIFLSQVDHYRSVNGRSIVHFLVQLCTGLLGKYVFNIFNVIVFAVFLWLLHKCTSGDKMRCGVSLLVILVLVLLLPRFKDAFLWMTGSINYLWSATAALGFLLIYEKRSVRTLDWSLIPLLLVAFLFGWTHEGITLPLGIALLLFHLFSRKRGRSNQQGLWLVLAFLVGGCMIALAPGTISRSGIGGGLSGLGLKVFAGFIVMGKLRLIYLALFATVIGWFIDREVVKRVVSRYGYLLLAVLLSLGIVFVSGMESTRTAFGLEFFSMLFLLHLMSEWIVRLHPQVVRWLSIALSAGLLAFYALLLSHAIPSWQESRNLIAQIERTNDGIISTNEHRAGCFSSYVCTMLSPDTTVNSINYDPHGWPASIAATYHRDSLVFLPQAFLDELKANPHRFDKLDMDSPYEFYVQRIDDATQIENVTFELSPNDFSDVPFILRPVAHKMNRYTDTTVPTTKWAIVTLYGNRYVLIKKDHTTSRRLLRISFQKD